MALSKELVTTALSLSPEDADELVKILYEKRRLEFQPRELTPEEEARLDQNIKDDDDPSKWADYDEYRKKLIS